MAALLLFFLVRGPGRPGAGKGKVPWSVLQQALLEALRGPAVGSQAAGARGGAPGAMPLEESKFEQMLRAMRHQGLELPGQGTERAAPSGAEANGVAGGLTGQEARELLGCIRSLQSAAALDSLAARCNTAPFPVTCCVLSGKCSSCSRIRSLSHTLILTGTELMTLPLELLLSPQPLFPVG